MRHPYRLILRHAKRRTLRMRCAFEFYRRDIGGRDSMLFKIDYIVRTARNAAPSIAEGFDDGIALLPQFLFDLLRGHLARRDFLAP